PDRTRREPMVLHDARIRLSENRRRDRIAAANAHILNAPPASANPTADPLSEPQFIIEAPQFDPQTGEAIFAYRLGELRFIEILRFPAAGIDPARSASNAFAALLDLTAAVLG